MLSEHLGYLQDRRRLARFKEAIASVVQRGDRVADLGCGSGLLGMMCLQAGATHAYEIESEPIIIAARQSFERAGLADRATFLRTRSFVAELPEPVDLAICDHVGYFGVDYGILELLRDARDRLLKPGGRLAPAGLKLYLGAVQSPTCRDSVDAWSNPEIPSEFRWLGQHNINTKHSAKLEPDHLLSAPVELCYLDFYQDQPDFFSWTAELRISRDGVFHGLAGWFDCKLADDVWMTNSPLSDEAIDRQQAFFPISEPVEVRAGALVTAKVRTRPDDHMIAWTVEFPATGRTFKHSTLDGMVLDAGDLMHGLPERVPLLSPEGRARVTVLSYCDGRRTAREVEQAVLAEHPMLLPSKREISRFVASVLSKDAT
ncbi:50S ribosomal protein L11 methyltransferase [Terricaulis silvestris]|uniref:Ribosomal protein L11 methyltransferase n=1 Tax=Terricaulis silvestris TaxID=2686094 RepID=A0A6I6ML55_9CAUL|nr:50S ribosomal protein L11 methyltransferase [Terricaulis silvestris]QGZ93387.1 ribosomal protein L11 methyltransferase [Terricaulis silvestris]